MLQFYLYKQQHNNRLCLMALSFITRATKLSSTQWNFSLFFIKRRRRRKKSDDVFNTFSFSSLRNRERENLIVLLLWRASTFKRVDQTATTPSINTKKNWISTFRTPSSSSVWIFSNIQQTNLRRNVPFKVIWNSLNLREDSTPQPYLIQTMTTTSPPKKGAMPMTSNGLLPQSTRSYSSDSSKRVRIGKKTSEPLSSIRMDFYFF